MVSSKAVYLGWWCRRYKMSVYLYQTSRLTSHKTENLRFSATRTSNLTKFFPLHLSFPHTYSKDDKDMWQFYRGHNIGSMNLNLYISAKQNHIIFYSEMTTCSVLKRPSSGHHYRSSKIRYISVKIMLAILDLTWHKSLYKII